MQGREVQSWRPGTLGGRSFAAAVPLALWVELDSGGSVETSWKCERGTSKQRVTSEIGHFRLSPCEQQVENRRETSLGH